MSRKSRPKRRVWANFIMDLILTTPDIFPAFPYDPPYSIQLDLMRHLYSSIENKKVSIVESPTGTVCFLLFHFH